jgi:hypothetical protein
MSSPCLGIECAERLVHEEHARIGNPGARNGRALAHAAGKLIGGVALEAA